VVVADLRERDRRHLGDLVDDPARVGRVREPGPQPRGRGGGRHPVADDVLLEEVLPDELLEATPQVVLAFRDQRGVRHR
jgi:hypothetical protein